MVKQAKKILLEEWHVLDADTGHRLAVCEWPTGAEEEGRRWIKAGECRAFLVVHMREVCDE